MKLLLDTHTFLWWICDHKNLSDPVREAIGNGRNEVFLSAISVWEWGMKLALGRLQLNETPEHFIATEMTNNGFQPLPIQIRHVLQMLRLPHHHQDPFDRLLIAQAQLEDLTLLSADQDLKKYDVEVLW